MIEKYRTNLIPPAKIRTELRYNKDKRAENITDLEFSSVTLDNIEIRMMGSNVKMARCVVERVWATTASGGKIRGYRIDAIEGLSVVLTPPPVRRLGTPGTDIQGCIYVDTVAGRYRYVVDRWYSSDADRQADPIGDDTIDIAAAAHLAWADYNYNSAIIPDDKMEGKNGK